MTLKFGGKSMTTRMSWLVALFIVLASPPVVLCQSPAASGADTLTLEEAINLALRDNRQVKTTALEVSKYEDRLAAVRTRRAPEFKMNALSSQLLSSLDFKFEQGVFGNFPGIGPIPNADTTISHPRRPTTVVVGQINQPLSQLYRIGLSLKQLGAGREIAGQQEQAQRLAVINNVKRSYYAILQTQTGLFAAEESIKLYRELDRVTGEYIVQQVALKAEGLEVKTRLAKTEYDASTLRDQLASQKEQLNQLL